MINCNIKIDWWYYKHSFNISETCYVKDLFVYIEKLA